MPSNVRVAVRVRPLLAHEIKSGHSQTQLKILQDESVISIAQPNTRENQETRKNFRFDKIIDEGCSQAEVFEQLQIKGLISKVIEGFHATVFAYGQTGSGKTYTLEGYKYEEAKGDERAGKVNTQSSFGEVGLTVRAIKEIFN